ncbi:hypothetical protein, partial [Mycobacterium riyadhense]|uniref:hypothetical protein n=1 Tax=Mycobacterium riyadhense TaxID=486698 RepID=UPI0021F27390|nr:hypothetical protein [Mycobacterium riyadhense]
VDRDQLHLERLVVASSGPDGQVLLGSGKPTADVKVRIVDPDVEAFRAEFGAFLDENLPPPNETCERPRSVSHMPQWRTAAAQALARRDELACQKPHLNLHRRPL